RRPPATRTSSSAEARTSSTSFWRPAWSTRSSCTSRRSSWVEARVFSTESDGMSRSKSSARSQRRGSRTSSTASCTRSPCDHGHLVGDAPRHHDGHLAGGIEDTQDGTEGIDVTANDVGEWQTEILGPQPLGWVDTETGLEGPDFWRRLLVAEVARSARYGRPLTIVLLDINGLQDMLRAWGGQVTR